jgi:hypothetical protein
MDVSELDRPQRGWSGYLLRGCAIVFAMLLCLPLGFCAWLDWNEPRSALPEEIEWTEIVGFDSEFALREGCAFGVYRISAATAAAFSQGQFGPPMWHQTPVEMEDDQHALVGATRDRVTLYALHATGCASDDLTRMSRPLHTAMSESGNWYYVYNHGEGLVVLDPSAKLAWYLYFG